MAARLTENKKTLMRYRLGISEFQEATSSTEILSTGQPLLIKGSHNSETTETLMIFSMDVNLVTIKKHNRAKESWWERNITGPEKGIS